MAKLNITLFSNHYSSMTGHGMARYARELRKELSRIPDLNLIPSATWANCTKEQLEELKVKTNLKIIPGGRKLTPLAWLLLNNPPLELFLPKSLDITHIISLGFPVATRKKLVVTVHDIGPLTHNSYFSNSPLYLFKKSLEQMTRQADAIICVSQATADELIDYSKKDLSQRLHVIHEGVDADFFSQPPIDIYGEFDNNLLPRNVPFFLAVGAMSPRKNIARVLEAFSQVEKRIPHHLVLVGGSGWDSQEIFKAFKDSRWSEKVHHLGYVSDRQLQSLYHYAEFYIYPSLFEGFGLTILEAMAAQCPVITSNISSLPEIAGDAAKLVDPFSVEEIANAIEEFALKESTRKHYIKLGLENIKRFQWQKTAEQVAKIYRSL